MSVWYRQRIDCNLQGVQWGIVRSHIYARAIFDFVSTGSSCASFAPAIFDPRFFSYQFGEKQSELSAREVREITAWALVIWPDWSIRDFTVFAPVTWLETLNPQDKERTLAILEENYGFKRNSK